MYRNTLVSANFLTRKFEIHTYVQCFFDINRYSFLIS